MKKVLFIGMTPNQGGLETFMMNIFSKLEGHGFHFEFINTYNKPIAYTSFIKSRGGIIRNVRINRSHIGLLTRYFSAKRFFKCHHDYDIIHLNTLSLNNIYWLRAASHFSIPKLIIHSHDCNFVHNSRIVEILSKLLSIWNRRFLNNSNVIELAVSNDAGKWMFHNTNFKVIKNGINVRLYLFNKKRKYLVKNHELHLNDKCKVFITVARLVHQKNYRKIIRIFFNIHKLDNNTVLIIIGDGIERNIIKKLIYKLGLKSSVLLMGFINNVSDFLNIADLMIMPSYYEGLPFALIESQASGVPAIVSSEAIPRSSNITNALKYVSLNKSDFEWAKISLNMASHLNNCKKIKMNKKVENSQYNVNYLIEQIKHVYCFS